MLTNDEARRIAHNHRTAAGAAGEGRATRMARIAGDETGAGREGGPRPFVTTAAAPGSDGMRDGFRPGLQCLDWGHRRAGRRREPGRRGLLSGEGLLFAGALILVLARSWSIHRAQPEPAPAPTFAAYGEDRAGAHRRESRFRGFKRCACRTAAAARRRRTARRAVAALNLRFRHAAAPPLAGLRSASRRIASDRAADAIPSS
jgi:hypothetical protein